MIDQTPKHPGISLVSDLPNRRRVDPLSARELTRYQRQADRVRFICKAVAGIAGNITGWSRRNALHHRLTEMPDYLLKDIGLRRDQIEAVVRGDFERQTSQLEEAASQASLGFLADKADAAENAEADIEKPLAA